MNASLERCVRQLESYSDAAAKAALTSTEDRSAVLRGHAARARSAADLARQLECFQITEAIAGARRAMRGLDWCLGVG